MSTTNTAKTPPQANFRERNFFDFQSGGDIVSWGGVFLAVRFAWGPPAPQVRRTPALWRSDGEETPFTWYAFK